MIKVVCAYFLVELTLLGTVKFPPINHTAKEAQANPQHHSDFLKLYSADNKIRI